MQLIIGNKNYSSWSLRPWLLLTQHQIPFEEIRVALFTEGFQQELAKYSPSMRVPVLIDDAPDGAITVWDSLAICEYVSEKYLSNAGYPADLYERAQCRAYCSEMHSGFMAIRSQLPMNCRARRHLQLDAAILAEVRRVDDIWCEARGRHHRAGDYLFGRFSIADCMFAPMVMRFHTYGVPLSDTARAYMATLLDNRALQQWIAGATAEKEVLPDYELGQKLA